MEIIKLNFNNTIDAHKLTDIYQWGNMGFDDMSNSFKGCINLTTIHKPITGAENCEDFSYMFFSGSSLYSIPDNLFDNCYNALSFEYTFCCCPNLKTISGNLFRNCLKVQKFIGSFSHINLLGSEDPVPDIGITFIPDNLFSNNTLVDTFSECFQGCGAISEIPSNLFINNKLVTDFSWCFWQCKSITSIPENLFSECTEIINFLAVFGRCINLQNIPDKIFTNNTKVQFFDNVFYHCESLTEIPPTLFETNTECSTIADGFSRCWNIIEVPSTLFENNNKIENFTFCFNKCYSITGNVPELWNTHPLADGRWCFSLSLLIKNYKDASDHNWASVYTERDVIFNETYLTNPHLFVMEINIENHTIPFTIPLNTIEPSIKYNFIVDFGDGVDWGFNSEYHYIDSSSSSAATHTYSSNGKYKVKILGRCEHLYFNGGSGEGTEYLKLTNIIKWGNLQMTTLANSFSGCFNLTQIPNDKISGTNGVIDSSGIFWSTSITTIPSNLFQDFYTTLYFDGAFQNCIFLETIPTTLFNYSPNIASLDYCFYQCSQLTGPAPELWNMFPTAKGTGYCFGFCNGLSNYAAALSAGWANA